MSPHVSPFSSSPFSSAPVWTRATKNRVVDERDERGQLQIFLPAAKLPDAPLCVTRVTGHLTLRMAHQWIAVLDPYFGRGTVFDTFHDWEKMTSYDSSARRSLTTWVVANHSNVRVANFLVGSKLVAMGVSAASLAAALVGLNMRAHTERAAFERDLDRALE